MAMPCAHYVSNDIRRGHLIMDITVDYCRGSVLSGLQQCCNKVVYNKRDNWLGNLPLKRGREAAGKRFIVFIHYTKRVDVCANAEDFANYFANVCSTKISELVNLVKNRF